LSGNSEVIAQEKIIFRVIAQSVLLVVYELSQKTYSITSPILVKYTDNRDLETRIMRNLKHLIGRTGLTDWELKMAYSICSQVDKKLRNSP
jgi:tRNA C32,U32 (ribose-2'-O)-methylase TrmJ